MTVGRLCGLKAAGCSCFVCALADGPVVPGRDMLEDELRTVVGE
jgi:hypothetical protein